MSCIHRNSLHNVEHFKRTVRTTPPSLISAAAKGGISPGEPELSFAEGKPDRGKRP
jgi:hypothetical protein